MATLAVAVTVEEQQPLQQCVDKQLTANVAVAVTAAVTVVKQLAATVLVVMAAEMQLAGEKQFAATIAVALVDLLGSQLARTTDMQHGEARAVDDHIPIPESVGERHTVSLAPVVERHRQGRAVTAPSTISNDESSKGGIGLSPGPSNVGVG